MDGTSTGDGRQVESDGSGGCEGTPPPGGGARVAGPSTQSILIHEVKSGPNRLAHEENGDFGVRLGRLAGHVERNQDFARWLADVEPRRSEKLSTCGTWLMFREYFEMKGRPKKLAAGLFCQQPLWCGFCAAGQAARQSMTLAKKFNEVIRPGGQIPYMVTLTAKSDSDLGAMKGRVWAAWAKLMQRRRDARKGKSDTITGPWEGGFVSGEVKRGKGGHGWHYHLHGLVLDDSGRFAPRRERLTREWAGLLGQKWASTQFEPVARTGSDPVASAIIETCKYAVKWDGRESFEDRAYAANALHRVRRVRTFGCLYGLKLPDDVTDDMSEYEGQAFRELVYRYLDGSYQKRETLEAQRETAFDEWDPEHAIDD